MVADRGKSFDPTQIRKALKKAGFTLRDVLLTARGTLARQEGALELRVPGLERPFLLQGGPRATELAGRADLLGTRIRLSGHLRPSHGEAAPGLTVDDFARAP